MEFENKIWLDDESLGYTDDEKIERENVDENIHGLTKKELKDIEEFLALDCELDEEIFNAYFVDLGTNRKQVYQDYVTIENKVYDNFDTRTFEDFENALTLALEDRFYTEINRYVEFSNKHIYYINDNTLLFDN